MARAGSALSRGLRDLGVEAGDRVVLVSENRPEWVVADLAVMAAGAITVPAYVTNRVQDHAHILGDSAACVAIVSTAALARPLVAAAAETPSLKHTIAMEALDGGAGGDIPSWEDVMARGAALADHVAARAAVIAATETPSNSGT